MPTASARLRARPQSSASGRTKAKTSSRRSKPVSAVSKRTVRAGFEQREKLFAELFGQAIPKNRVLTPDGEFTPAEMLESGDIGVLQYQPMPSRMSWVYITNGLSQAKSEKREPSMTELLLHWKHRDKLPLKILTEAARFVVKSGISLRPGDIIRREDASGVGTSHFPHCIANAMDGPAAKTKGLQILLLVGISEAEAQCALRVNPDLADGRQVLLEALRTSGVYPMTDPGRVCITRRSDFMRIWETAFRVIREKKPKA